MVNQDQKLTRIVSSRLTFVPYKEAHVRKYHGWMKDERIQYLTGSEPLSLEEEFEMQKKWARDEDKCTFIILDNQLLGSVGGGNGSGSRMREATDARSDRAESPSTSQSTQQIDRPDRPINQPALTGESSGDTDEIRSMIGDTNLFLNNTEAPDEAEIEIMIAERAARGKGLGREALRMMIKFAFEKLALRRLVAKIKQDNQVSIVLFKSLGFEEIGKSDVFQEYTFQLDAQNPTVQRILEIELIYRSDRWE